MPHRVLGPQTKRRTLGIPRGPRMWLRKNWGIAQLIERQILALKVPGLIPGTPTICLRLKTIRGFIVGEKRTNSG